MNFMFIGIIIILGSVVFGRQYLNKAFLKLPDDKRLELMDIFAKTKIWSMLIPTFLFALFFLTLQFEILDLRAAALIFVLSMFGYVFAKTAQNRRILIENHFPDSYIKAYFQSEIIKSLILIIGVVVMNSEHIL